MYTPPSRTLRARLLSADLIHDVRKSNGYLYAPRLVRYKWHCKKWDTQRIEENKSTYHRVANATSAYYPCSPSPDQYRSLAHAEDCSRLPSPSSLFISPAPLSLRVDLTTVARAVVEYAYPPS